MSDTDRIKELEAENTDLAARALEAEAKLAKVQYQLEKIAATDTQAWALRALADIKERSDE